MTEDEWKARAVGCEAESKRLAGEVKRLTAELERMTQLLMDTHAPIGAAAMWYRDMEESMKLVAAAFPGLHAERRRVDYRAKQMECRRLNDIIEAIEDARFNAIKARSQRMASCE